MLTKRTIFYPLVFLLIMYIFSCVDEPDYINTKRSDLPAPAIKYVEQQDAFSLLIKWYVLNQDDHLVDHFLIESFSSNDSLTMNQSLFDTEMADNPAAREIIINRNDSILAEMVIGDSIFFEYVDQNASFAAWNYYRITVLFDEIKSYSVLTENGNYFGLKSPTNFTIQQLDDYQLHLTWDNTRFAESYQIKRILSTSVVDTTFVVADTSMIDFSYNPRLSGDVFSVRGIQPNYKYTYALTAQAVKDTVFRASEQTILEEQELMLLQPVIRASKSINNSTIRLYIPQDSIDDNLDSMFVLRNIAEQWEILDTFIIQSMDHYYYDYRQEYLIDDNIGEDNTDSIQYKVMTKGNVNAVVSNVVSGLVLDIPGFTYAEGGEFIYGCVTCDTMYATIIDPFYIAIYEYSDEWPVAGGNFPLDNLSWVDGVQICEDISIQNNRTFRLPSEKEWEFAGKWDVISNHAFAYPWQSENISGDNANYMNSGDIYDNGLTPTGYYNGENGTINSFSPIGVYDLGGNVLEWCGSGNSVQDLDEISNNNYSGNDALKPMRGGGYWHSPELLKTTMRYGYDPTTTVSGFGLRIVMEDIE